MGKKKNIGDLLIECGKINNKDLEEGLRLQRQLNLRLGETLIKLGKVTRDDLEWVLSKQLDIPFVMVENINLDPKLMYKFSKKLLINNRILPLYETDEEIAIATDDPLNKDVFESIEGFLNKKIKLSSGNGEKIKEILTQFFKRAGVPALISCIENLLEKIKGTSFYRIDFILSENSCEINVFGFGIVKKLEILNDSYKKEQIFESFEALNIAFLYDLYSNENSLLVSIYPIINRLEDISFPAIIGMFGLFLPHNITFADTFVNQLPFGFNSYIPVEGYTFISTKNKFLDYKKTVFTVDSVPESFDSFYADIPIPEKCDLCGSKGCKKCKDLGYIYPKRMLGIYSFNEIKEILEGVKRWQG